MFAVLGMRLSVKAYPEGPPIRDAAHARLIARFRAELPPGVTLRTEVPLLAGWPIRAAARSRAAVRLRAEPPRLGQDLRAWDGQLETADATCKLEAETVLYDLQAQERRVALKMADDGVIVVILLVADTRRNRQVLAEFGELIAARFPLDTRAVMTVPAGGAAAGAERGRPALTCPRPVGTPGRPGPRRPSVGAPGHHRVRRQADPIHGAIRAWHVESPGRPSRDQGLHPREGHAECARTQHRRKDPGGRLSQAGP